MWFVECFVADSDLAVSFYTESLVSPTGKYREKADRQMEVQIINTMRLPFVLIMNVSHDRTSCCVSLQEPDASSFDCACLPVLRSIFARKIILACSD